MAGMGNAVPARKGCQDLGGAPESRGAAGHRPKGRPWLVGSMKRLLLRLLGGQLQPVLVACFSLVAALTVGLSTVVTLQVITDYLDQAMNERVGRDMDLAGAFYQLKLDEVIAVGQRMGRDPQVVSNLETALAGDAGARLVVDQELSRKITVPAIGGTHLILVLDTQGDIILGRALNQQGELSPPFWQGSARSLPIVTRALSVHEQLAATEILPADFLAQVGLEEQASVPVTDTPLAAPQLHDPREGTAGLGLVSVLPVTGQEGTVLGALLVAYLFNNDFSLVDRIREVAGVDTATLFFGDLRVSTNVMTEEGGRATGTRLSQDVYEVVLVQERDYVGRAFVVNDWFITRYQPLRDHMGQVVGILYVGARESSFRALVDRFSGRVAMIALVSIALAGIIALPIARLLTRPIKDLVDANRRLADGDMTVRVHASGSGELAELGRSFNAMSETLELAQRELLQKERLASMGQLAAGVAHELNNPLGSIMLFADVMYKEADVDDLRREDLRLIINETFRCKNIVADLLNFARENEVLAQEVDIAQLLDGTAQSVRRQASFENVAIVREYAPDLPLIQADPDQLRQVFVNLLVNAAEAITDRGTITLAARPVDRSFVEIRVSDTGCGIAEENLGRLFTPFFTTKPIGKGTGLGLSIVYGIVKVHRGQITVQSRVGQGTTFTIRLPIKAQARSTAMIGSIPETSLQ
jgi:two-component system, NtrC family, sensor kinase